MSIKNRFKELMFKFGIKKVKKKSSILKEVIDNPENVKLEAYIEGDEIVVKIKRKNEETPES